MPGSMLILTWVGIIFVKILHLAFARCIIMTNIMPTHVKMSIEPASENYFLNNAMVKRKRTNNDLQNIHINLKIE